MPVDLLPAHPILPLFALSHFRTGRTFALALASLRTSALRSHFRTGRTGRTFAHADFSEDNRTHLVRINSIRSGNKFAHSTKAMERRCEVRKQCVGGGHGSTAVRNTTADATMHSSNGYYPPHHTEYIYLESRATLLALSAVLLEWLGSHPESPGSGFGSAHFSLFPPEKSRQNSANSPSSRQRGSARTIICLGKKNDGPIFSRKNKGQISDLGVDFKSEMKSKSRNRWELGSNPRNFNPPTSFYHLSFLVPFTDDHRSFNGLKTINQHLSRYQHDFVRLYKVCTGMIYRYVPMYIRT